MSDQPISQTPFLDLPEGTVTFLFTDIEGSTKLLQRLRDKYAVLLGDQRRLLRQAFAHWNGHEVDTQGDAFFVAFLRATQAVAAAVEAQRLLADYAWPEGVAVRVRMGIHTGEPWKAEEGYVGMDVHRAARLAHVAHGGQVLLSETVTALAQDELPEGVSLLDLGRHLLKDIHRPERIHQIVIQGLPSEFPPLTTQEALPAENARQKRPVGDCPYRGLSAFQEADARFYFGRESFIALLQQAVVTQPMVAVIVGSSGSGKSSALFAGLLPRLRTETGWEMAVLRPGSQPFNSLAGALLSLLEPSLSETDRLVEIRKLSDGFRQGEVDLLSVVERILQKRPASRRILLVVDQFEELYTLCPEADLQRQFINALLAALQVESGPRHAPLVLMLTLRADFMGQALAHRPFADALQEASLLMGPMTRDELRVAIEKPAEMQGAAFEHGLVERILDDVGEKPGNLPLLEFTLTMLWDKQTDGWLTHANYEAMGGVEGALASYADQVYAGLDPDNQERARGALVQLVQPGEGTEDTRRIATRQELGDEGWMVIQRLADRRLVVTGRDAAGNEIAEVVHEALIQKWDCFQEWMDADRTFRAWQEHLRGNMRQWQESDQDEGALLAGAPLEVAQKWLTERGRYISQAEAGYIQAGLALQVCRQMERNQAASRLRRRAVWLSLALGIAFVLMLAAALFARQSSNNARLATARELAGASVSNLEVDQQRSILLALQALKTVDLPEARAALHQAIQYSRLRDSLSGHQKSVYGVVYSPNGKDFASASTDGTIKVWTLDQGGNKVNRTALLTIPNPIDYDPSIDAAGYTLAFSPDGTRLAAVSEKHTAKVWEIPTGKLLYMLEGHTGAVYSVAFSPKGNLLATTSADLTVKLWDALSGKDLQTLTGHTNLPATAVFSPDGKYLASVDVDGLAMIWEASELPAAQAIYKLSYSLQVNQGVCSIAFSPDGTTLALGGTSLIIVYEITGITPSFSTRLFLNIPAHVSCINSLYFNPASDRLVSGSTDGQAKVWDAATGLELFTLAGNAGGVNSISLSPDGRRLLTAHLDSTIKLWDLSESGNQEWFTAVEDQGPPISILGRDQISPDGKRLADISVFSTVVSVYLWDLSVSSIRPFRSMNLPLSAQAYGIAVSPDFALLATAETNMDTGDNSVEFSDIRIWDLATGQFQTAFSIRQAKTDTGHTMAVWGLKFSPDGKKIATGSDDGTAILWDWPTGKAVQTFIGHTGMIMDLAFSPDGARLATASYDGTACIWDVTSGKTVLELKGHTNALRSVVYSLDGKRLLTGSADKTAKLWDAQSGREIQTLSGHTSTIFSVAFSPDGRYLATGSVDGTVKAWDAATGQELFSFPGMRVEFSPDGRHLVTYDVYGVMRGFYLDMNDLLQVAHSRLTRSWTPEECQKFLNTDTCPPAP